MPFYPESEAVALVREFRETNKTLLACLDNMPLAIAVIRLELDENNAPVDFTFVYGNEALAKLEKLPLDKLLGASFYRDLFPAGDKKWLDHYWETATRGTVQTLNNFSPEIDRFLEVKCFQPCYGLCACILTDVSGKIFLERELEDARRSVELALKNTLDYMFFYDLDKRAILNDNDIVPCVPNLPLRLDNAPYSLLEYGILRPESLDLAEEVFRRLHSGSGELVEDFEMNLTGEPDNFQWYKVKFIPYDSLVFKKKYILIMAHNIHKEVLYRTCLEQDALMDPLTHLYNRKAALRIFEERTNIRQGKALFLFDLDDFKGINDTYGHQTGDDTLCFFANTLKHAFRKDDIVFRLGGDEFAAFAQTMDLNFVKAICANILAQLRSQKEFSFAIRTSIGVAVSKEDLDYTAFYKAADKALYHAKTSGKDNWYISVLPDD